MVLISILCGERKLFAAQSPQSSNCDSTSTESFHSLQQLSNSLPSILAVSQVKDIPEFCRINGIRDAKETEAFGMNWTDSFTPSLDRREASFLNNFIYQKDSQPRNLDPKCPGPDCEKATSLPKDTFDSIRTELLRHPEMPKEERANCSRQLTFLQREEAQVDQDAPEYKVGVAQAMFACKDVTLLSLAGCAQGLTIVRKIARPVRDMTLIGTWKEVVTDPVYYRVFHALALRMLDRIGGRVKSDDRLFDDISRLFQDEVKDPKLAKEYTWKTMGFLATAGTNLAFHTGIVCGGPTPEKNALHEVLYVIGMAPVIIDRLTAPQGYLYSYPREVNDVCDYGKSYHFWMTAYLAREVAKQTGNETAAAAAAFTAEKGYQFLTQTAGRDPSQPFKANAFSNYNNNIRLDLTQAAAGAWFGAMSLKPNQKQVDRQQFDNGIRNTFDGVRMIPINSKYEFPGTSSPLRLLGAYSDWKKVSNPDASFEYFEKLMKQ